MNSLRARMLELPARERFWATAGILFLAGLLGWWAAEWVGAVAGVGIASQALFGKSRQRPQPPVDADAERLERDLQHRRDQAFEIFHPGETRTTATLEEDPVDQGDAYYLEKDLAHRRREAARLLQATPTTGPSSAPERSPAVLFPPDPRPLPPAPRRAELFKGAPPPQRPIVEEGSRLFRRARRSSGKIVE